MEHFSRIVVVMLIILGVSIAILLLRLILRRFRSRRGWRLHGYGGGAAILIGDMSREKAVTYCADHHGIVMFVDEQKRWIFFKPKP